MICSGALRLGSIDAAARVVLLLVSAVVWLSACAGSSSAPPQTLPTPPATVEQVNDVADLLNEAEAYFSQGEDAYNRGEYEVADDRFQRALDVYLDANIATQDRDTLHAALINLFNRIHVAMSIDGLIGGPDEFVSAENEELPSPSAEDLADLQATESDVRVMAVSVATIRYWRKGSLLRLESRNIPSLSSYRCQRSGVLQTTLPFPSA